jgi:disulfide bond formation protein DsbB
MSNPVRFEMDLLRLVAILSFSAVAVALISQHVFDMQPCAWCVFQRLLYLMIGAVALLLTFVNPTRLLLAIGSASILAASIAGVTSAWYQEKVAANNFSCAQTFADQIMTKSGLDAAVPWLFGIYASCMDARVKLLGIEYAWWSLAMFFLLGIFALIALKKLLR